MANMNVDRETLRELADEGNETLWTGWPTSQTQPATSGR